MLQPTCMYIYFLNPHAIVHPTKSACCSRHVCTFIFTAHMQLFILLNRHVAADMYIYFPNAHHIVYPTKSACCRSWFISPTHCLFPQRTSHVYFPKRSWPPRTCCPRGSPRDPSKNKSCQISIDVGALIFDRLDPCEDFLHRNVVRGEKLIIRGSVVEARVESL